MVRAFRAIRQLHTDLQRSVTGAIIHHGELWRCIKLGFWRVGIPLWLQIWVFLFSLH